MIFIAALGDHVFVCIPPNPHLPIYSLAVSFMIFIRHDHCIYICRPTRALCIIWIFVLGLVEMLPTKTAMLFQLELLKHCLVVLSSKLSLISHVT
jgi:hypothetical protein